MGFAELQDNILLIYSHIITYGGAADDMITSRICREIEDMWNEPGADVPFEGILHRVRFRITGEYIPHLLPIDVVSNTNPRYNYFRIEHVAPGNISFVDGIGCNTGYFLFENLYEGSTTAAHEYGHTLGLVHPRNIDIRGQGVPGIMYPRGTIVDSIYQYNSGASPGDNRNGGTMHPKFRKVRKQDVEDLKLHKLEFENRTATVGEFSSVWHEERES
ncbi:MAG: peptidase M10 [Chitinophagaceae bacterium]|nr:peptidase M10 [Chitinophagaceae bacterium]